MMRISENNTNEWMKLLICFRYEAGYEAVGDGGTNPNLSHQIGSQFAYILNHDVIVVESGNGGIDDKDEPQVALGITLPLLAGIEES